jgi:ankyrin repeat protein
MTAIWIACYDNNLPMLQYLHNNGCDMNIQSSHGNTPLMQGAASGSIDCVKYLIDNGANIHLKNRVFIDYSILISIRIMTQSCMSVVIIISYQFFNILSIIEEKKLFKISMQRMMFVSQILLIIE